MGGGPTAFSIALVVFSLAAVYPWLAVARGTPAALASHLFLAGGRAAGAALFRHGWTTVLLTRWERC